MPILLKAKPKPLKIGDTFLNKLGLKMKVTNYVNSNTVTVRFDDGTFVRTRVAEIRAGEVKNPNHPSVCGKGYIGQGKYDTKHIKTYRVWHNMLARCFDNHTNQTVCERWLNFQHFAEDYYLLDSNNFIERGWIFTKCLSDCTEYNAETCCFLPFSILTFFTYPKQGKKTAVGVVHTATGGYKVNCVYNGKRLWFGTFDTEAEAECEYRRVKRMEFERLVTKHSKDFSEKMLKDLKLILEKI